MRSPWCKVYKTTGTGRWNLSTRTHGDTWSLCLRAPNRIKNRLPDRYAALADYAAGDGFAVYLCGSPSKRELALAEDIVGRCALKPANLLGHTSLKQLFALVQAADLVLSPDTGPLHMAIATGKPVIGLYARSDPARTGPYGRQEFDVDAYTPALQQQLGDKADGAPWGYRLKAVELMERITTQAVCDAFDRAVQELGD